MKKLSKKQIGVISTIAVILVATPLTVWAITYYSDLRQNAFMPASANIQIKEENKTPEDEQTNTQDYQFTLAENGNYHVDKNVAIYDERKKNDEYLKVLCCPERS